MFARLMASAGWVVRSWWHRPAMWAMMSSPLTYHVANLFETRAQCRARWARDDLSDADLDSFVGAPRERCRRKWHHFKAIVHSPGYHLASILVWAWRWLNRLRYFRCFGDCGPRNSRFRWAFRWQTRVCEWLEWSWARHWENIAYPERPTEEV